MSQKILVTGAFGQIGTPLLSKLQNIHGLENIVLVDISLPSILPPGIIELADATDSQKLYQIIQKHNITTVYHLASILSYRGEQNPQQAWHVNMHSLKLLLDIAVSNPIKIFWPSSMAVFGPTTPRTNTPQHTILEPTTMYGITKLTGENLCHYYHHKFGLDIRSLRLPGVISSISELNGGTTDFAVEMFNHASQKTAYSCYLRADTILPMIYIDDVVSAISQIMAAEPQSIQHGISYNLAGLSFTPQDLADQINIHQPLVVSYNPDERQKIADTWPQSIDDSQARHNWGWKPKYDLENMTATMLTKI